MKPFSDSPAPFTDMSMTLISATKSYVLQDGWRWIPAGLGAVLINAREAFTEIFWIVLILWAVDLFVGVLKAWHARQEEVEWLKVFRSILKLVVIAMAVIAMNAIEQMLGHTGLPLDGQLVVTTLFVIGSADAFSILANLTYFWPELGVVSDNIRKIVGAARPTLPTPPDPPHQTDQEATNES